MTTTTSKTETLKVGDSVQIHNPLCDPGWNTWGTIIYQDGFAPSFYGVRVGAGIYAGREGYFRECHLTLMPESYSVHDKEGLDVLPEGARVEDLDGDEATRRSDGHWIAWYCLSPNRAGGAEKFFAFPVVLLNPEVLERAVDQEDFNEKLNEKLKVGDQVLVSADAKNVLGNSVSFGGQEVVGRIIGHKQSGDFLVECSCACGSWQYVAPDYLTRVSGLAY